MPNTATQDGQITQDEAYIALENDVKEHLIKKLEMGKMSVQDVAKVCFLLGQAKTAEGLQFLVDNLKDDFDVLEEMEDIKASEEDVAVDQIVQKYVSDLIKTDPMKASEVGTRASEEGITLDTLTQEFPDLQNYI